MVGGRPFHPSVPSSIPSSIRPSIHPRQRGGGRRPFLNCKTPSGNCPFCPIYSTIGIHPVMKGYWPIIKISGRHWGRLGMQSVQPIFSFFWVLGRGGKGEKFSFFYWGWGSRHPSMEWRRQSCGNLSHSKEVVARSDRPQVVPSSVVFYFIFLRFFVCSHSGDLP